ncbi:MAG: hypothetical protein C4K60_18405 [Ideonella sp. MAG2]|nr:MAG: hypothetical protein C4K60_18405 [Ideonella sp. MAG2]
MRRDTFLKSLAAMAAVGALPLSANAAANLKMMIPANPGGGWDSTGRALGKALQDAGVASAVSYENKGGAAGALGLAQFVNASKGDPNALMVMGAVMLGGIITGKPPVSLTQATPIARITSEYNVFVLPRGVYAAPGITPEQRKALTDMVLAAMKSKSWAESLEKNAWTPAVLTGSAFDEFVDREFASLRAIMVKSGMI